MIATVRPPMYSEEYSNSDDYGNPDGFDDQNYWDDEDGREFLDFDDDDEDWIDVGDFFQSSEEEVSEYEDKDIYFGN